MDCYNNQRPNQSMDCGCGVPPTTIPPMMPRQQAGMMYSNRMNQMPQNRMARNMRTIDGEPIGMGYVPWQQWGQTYPLERALERGTIFPELDLPFMMGRCR